jgi:hypothetical protein
MTSPRSRPAAPKQIDELVLAPAARELLTDTMVRFNAAAETAAGVGFAQGVREPKELARAAAEPLAKLGLPATLRRIAVERAASELGAARRKPKFGRFQTVPYGDSVAWPAPTQARLWTSRGHKNVPVEPDPTYGWVRSPLEGRPVSLQKRGEVFYLVADDRELD